MSSSPRSKLKLTVIFGLLFAGLFASEFLGALSSLSTLLPLSKLASYAYEDANFSSVLKVKIVDAQGINSFNPYSGIEKITDLLNPFSFAIFIALVVLLGSLCFAFMLNKVGLIPQVRVLHHSHVQTILVAFVAISAALVAGYLSISSWNNSSWDEVSLFATQVDSVKIGRLNTVSITGPLPFAEASVDTGAIFGAAFLSTIFEVTAFTAVHLWSAVGVVLLCLMVTVVVYGKSKSLTMSVLASLAFGPFFVPIIAASAGGFPVAWAAISLVILLLAAKKSVLSQKMIYVSAASFFAFAIRTDYAIVGILTIFVCFLYLILDSHFKVIKGMIRQTLIPVVVFFILPVTLVTLFRILEYGIAVPAGALGKGTGIYSDYILEGLKHLDVVNQTTQILTLSVIPIVVIAKCMPRIDKIIVAAISLPPIASAIIAGGDWFPSNWARYYIPVFCVIIVASIPISKASGDSGIEEIQQVLFLKKMATVSLVIMLVGTLSISPGRDNLEHLVRPQQSKLEYASSWNQRTTCLAQAGKAIGIVFPKDVGFATSEINTLAYYSKQSLTDLQGLVDPRVASQPLRPLEHGISFQKRRLKDIIRIDKPGLVYVTEPVCVSGLMNYPMDPAWQSPDPEFNINGTLEFVRGQYSLGRPGEQFRNGSVRYLSDVYELNHISWATGYILIAVREDLIETVVKNPILLSTATYVTEE